MGGFHANYFREIIESRKELGNYLLEIEDFDLRGLDLFFEEKKKY